MQKYRNFKNLSLKKALMKSNFPKSKSVNNKDRTKSINEQNNKINNLESFIKRLCDLLRNQKIKQLAEELNHGERTNSDSEKE